MTPLEAVLREFGYSGAELPDADRNIKVVCPFHSDAVASGSANAGRGLFYCFTCGVSGDVFSLIMKAEEVTFNQARQRVEEITGRKSSELQATATGGTSRNGVPARSRAKRRHYQPFRSRFFE